MTTDKEKSQSQLIAELEQARERIVRLKSRTSGERIQGDSAGDSVLDLSPGDHLCCVYRNEQEHRAVLAPFVRSGLEQGHKVLYIADDRTAETVMRFLQEEGIPLEHYTACGQFAVLSSWDTYLKGDQFDPQAMIELLRQETDQALGEGYAALRITGEMSWALRGLTGSERLMEYECELNRFLPNNPAIGLCQYDMRRFEPGVILDVLDTHPIAVVGDRYYENTYYLSPEEYLGQNRPEAELSRRLEHLERKRLDEEALRESEASYREIFEHAPVGIFQTDSTGAVHRINSEMANILGASSSEEALEHFRNLDRDLYVYPERRDKFLRLLRERGEVQNFEYQARRLGGGSVWLSMNARISQWLPDGSFLIEGFSTDITEYKRAEAALRESESKFRNIFNSSSDAIFIHDSQGRFLEVNDVACERLGYTRQELLRMGSMDIDGPEASRRASERIQLLQRSGRLSFEATHVRKDGEEIPVEITSRLIEYEGKTCILSTARDISARKRAERELERSRYLLDKSQEIAHLGSWEVDVPTGRLTWSDETYRIFGLEPQQLKMDYETFLKFVHPEDRDAVDSAYMDSIRLNNDTYEIEHRIVRDCDWSVRTVFEKCYHVRDDAGNIVQSVGMIQDITNQRQKEEEIRKREEEIQTIFNTVKSGIILVDRDGRIIQANKTMAEMLYCDIKDIIASKYTDFVYESETDAAFTKMCQLMDGEVDSVHLERLYQRMDGTTFWGSLSGRRLYYPDGSFGGLVGVITDITERKQSEDKIRHLNRVLSAIRNVNQLITAEKDQDRLIRGVCDRLIETRGYDSAWIALLDQAGSCSTWAQAGLEQSFPALAEEIAAGRFPVCSRQALDDSDLVVMRDAESLCTGCSLSEATPDTARIAAPLVHQGMVFGVMAVSLPSFRAEDEDELELVREVAGDIAFALYDIDLEQDRIRAEAALHDSERFLRFTLDGLSAHIAVLEQNGEIVLVNRAWREFASENGIPAKYVSEKMNYLTVCSEATGEYAEGAQAFAQGIGEVISGEREFFSLEYPCPSPEQERWFAGRVTPFLEKAPRRVIVAHEEITERKRIEERLREMSLYDALTGLYNRSMFEEEIRRLQDERYCPMGIIVCDINGLKLINDTLGHTQGDNLLRTFADILKRCFRDSDIMARIGGDEFAVLLPQSSLETVWECSQRIRREVSQHNAQDQNLDLSVALGYAVESGPGLDMRELFKRADDVMYKEKLQQSYSSRSATVQALIKTLEARDFITDGHAGRLHNYAQKLGHSQGLSEERLNDLQILARFHDLGKVGIPDHILFKPGRLTEEEFEEMKRHCEIGHRIAMSTSDLAPVADYILKHHEWWDGRGYPLGIQGEEIPLECRILAIVDAYDAMTSDRPYKGAMSHEETVRELKRCAGTQFDPALVEEFNRILGEIDG